MRKKTAGSKFRLTFHSQVGGRFVSYLRKHVVRARVMVSPVLGELSVALVNDRRMGLLHERFLNLAGPTDVLTFPMELNGKGEVVSGEVVICVPYARRAAKVHGVAVEKELLLYVIHGMLHLSGFDDRTAGQYKRMHRAEDDILARLGVGPVFDPSGRFGGRLGER
jgi:probable rRNA maturation factor